MKKLTPFFLCSFISYYVSAQVNIWTFLKPKKLSVAKTTIDMANNYNMLASFKTNNTNTTYAKAILKTSFAENPEIPKIEPVGYAMVLPFKLRENNTWEPSVTLGAATGIRYAIGKDALKSWGISILGYIGGCKINVDSTNSKSTTNQTRDAITAAAMFGIEPFGSKGILLNFTIGWDFNTNNNTDNWKYNNSSWISFGISQANFTSLKIQKAIKQNNLL